MDRNPGESVPDRFRRTQMKAAEETLYNTDKVYVCKHKVAKPTVFIPVLPGTNCELRQRESV